MDKRFNKEKIDLLKSLDLTDLARQEISTQKDMKALDHKERLLNQSLDLIRDDDENGSACEDIISEALELGLFDLTLDAFYAIHPSNKAQICAALRLIFETQAYWPSIKESFLVESVKRLLSFKGPLETSFSISGRGWQLCDDEKSNALAAIGMYLLHQKRTLMACKLWERVPDQVAVEECLTQLLLDMIRKTPNQAEAVEALIETVTDKKRKAHILLTLSRIDPEPF